MASNEPPEGRNNVPDAVRGPQTAVVATACQDGDCVDKDCYKVSFITVDGGKDKGREEEGSDDEEDEDGYENGEKALIEKWCKRLAWNLLDDEPFGQLGYMSKLMSSTQKKHVSIRRRLRKRNPAFRMRFFEELLRNEEPTMSSIEDKFEAETRFSCMAREHCNAYEKFIKKNWEINDKFEEYVEKRLQKNFKEAYLAISDAIFACLVLGSCPGLVDHFLETEEDMETKKSVPISQVYLDLRIKQIEALFLDEQYKKASIYSLVMLRWMISAKHRGLNGYYTTFLPDRFVQLQMYISESECRLLNFEAALNRSNHLILAYTEVPSTIGLDKSMFALRQTAFERLIEYYETTAGDKEEAIALDRICARIIVDPRVRQSYVAAVGKDDKRQQLVVKDLHTALRVAKQNDLIFLEEGVYEPPPWPPKFNEKREKQGKRRLKPLFEFARGVHVVGASTSKTVISGSLVKHSKGMLILRRLKLQIGTTPESDDDAYFIEGDTLIRQCVVESPVDTAMFVISRSSEVPTCLSIDLSVLDGQETCKRLIAFEGPKPCVHIKGSYVLDAMSLCTVNLQDEECNAKVQLLDSVLYDLQDGLKIVTNPKFNQTTVEVKGTQIDLISLNGELPSHAFSQVGGSAMLDRNYVSTSNVDATGFSFHDVKVVYMDKNIVETTDDTNRQTAIGDGVVMSEVKKAQISETEVIGMRVGFKFYNDEPQGNEYLVKDCTARQCCIGLQIPDQCTWNCGHGFNRPRPEFCRCPKDVKKPLDAISINGWDNLALHLSGCQFDTCHFGVTMEDEMGTLAAVGCTFYDVAKPITFCKNSVRLGTLDLRQNTYKYDTEALFTPYREALEAEQVAAAAAKPAVNGQDRQTAGSAAPAAASDLPRRVDLDPEAETVFLDVDEPIASNEIKEKKGNVDASEDSASSRGSRDVDGAKASGQSKEKKENHVNVDGPTTSQADEAKLSDASKSKGNSTEKQNNVDAAADTESNQSPRESQDVDGAKSSEVANTKDDTTNVDKEKRGGDDGVNLSDSGKSNDKSTEGRIIKKAVRRLGLSPETPKSSAASQLDQRHKNIQTALETLSLNGSDNEMPPRKSAEDAMERAVAIIKDPRHIEMLKKNHTVSLVPAGSSSKKPQPRAYCVGDLEHGPDRSTLIEVESYKSYKMFKGEDAEAYARRMVAAAKKKEKEKATKSCGSDISAGGNTSREKLNSVDMAALVEEARSRVKGGRGMSPLPLHNMHEEREDDGDERLKHSKCESRAKEISFVLTAHHNVPNLTVLEGDFQSVYQRKEEEQLMAKIRPSRKIN